jgi:hypothetical protein
MRKVKYKKKITVRAYRNVIITVVIMVIKIKTDLIIP